VRFRRRGGGESGCMWTMLPRLPGPIVFRLGRLGSRPWRRCESAEWPIGFDAKGRFDPHRDGRLRGRDEGRVTTVDREIRVQGRETAGGRPWAIAWMLLLIKERERRASFHLVGKYDLVRECAGEDCGCRDDGIRPRVLPWETGYRNQTPRRVEG
jgi:hypothetical protein